MKLFIPEEEGKSLNEIHMSIGSLYINIPYKWMFIFTPYVEHQRLMMMVMMRRGMFETNKTWETSE